MAKSAFSKKTAALSAALLASLLVFGVAYLWLAPLELTRFHSHIESAIYKKTGNEVTLERVVLKVLPSPDLFVGGIKLYRKGAVVFEADSFRIRLRLLPILWNSYVIEDLDLDRGHLSAVRDKKGVLNFSGLLSPGAPEEKKGRGPSIEVKSLRVIDSSVTFTDESVPQRPEYRITGIKASIGKTDEGGVSYSADALFTPGTLITVSGKAEPGFRKFTGSGAIKDFNLSFLNPYLAASSAGASVSGKADLAVSYVYSRDLSVNGNIRYRDLAAVYPAALGSPLASRYGSAAIKYERRREDLALEVGDIRLFVDGFDIFGSFNMKGPLLERVFLLELRTSPIPFARFKALLPVKQLPEPVAAGIDKFEPLGGTIALRDLKAAGPMQDLKSGATFRDLGGVSGAVALRDIGFMYDGLRRGFSGINGGLVLKDRAISVSGIRGRYGKEEIEDLDARLRDLTGRLAYDVSVKGRFDAAEALGIARELTSRNEGLKERLDALDTSGEVLFNTRFSGAVREKSPVRYSGSASVKDAMVAYRGVPAVLKTLNGAFSFDNRRIDVKGLRGGDGHSFFSVNGSVEGYTEKVPSFSLEAAGEVAGESLKRLIRERRLNDLSVEGSMPFRVNASGTTRSFEAGALFDFTPTHIRYAKVLSKDEDYPMVLEASGRLAGSDLAVNEAVLKFRDSSVRLSGTGSLETKAYNVSLSSRQLRLADLDYITPYMVKDYEADGLVSFKVSAAKESQQAPASYQGEVRVQNARFTTPVFAEPVQRINASAEFGANSAHIALTGLTVGRSELRGTVDVPDIINRHLKFDLFSPYLDTDDLVPKRKKEEKEAKPQAPAGEKKKKGQFVNFVEGVLNIQEGNLRGHKFSGFAAKVDTAGKVARFEPVSVLIDGGQISGNLHYYLDTSEPLLFKSELKLQDIHFDTMLRAFGAKSDIISGDVQGDVKLTQRRGASPLTSGLNGEAYLYSRRGKLWKFSVFSDIFSIVNILSIDELFKQGLPYRQISGFFRVKDGIITTNNLFFNSDSLKMTASGNIDLPRSSIDSILALHPLVTLDKIISAIPLAGWVIAGKEKSTVSLYFEIAGPLKSPSFEPKPIVSIEKGVLGFFKRLLEAPFEALKPSE